MQQAEEQRCHLDGQRHAATWMQRRLELKTGIKLQLLFSLLPLLSYCLLLSMLFSLLLLSFSLLPLFSAAPEFLPFRSSRIPSVWELPNSFRCCCCLCC